MLIYYAYSQISQIVIRISSNALENALREKLRPQLLCKQTHNSFTVLEDSETIDLIDLVCNNTERQMMAILNTGIRIIRLEIQQT